MSNKKIMKQQYWDESTQQWVDYSPAVYLDSLRDPDDGKTYKEKMDSVNITLSTKANNSDVTQIRQELSEIGVVEVIKSHTLVWTKDNATNGYTYTIDEASITYDKVPKCEITRLTSYDNVSFDYNTKYFTINNILDISYDEMVAASIKPIDCYNQYGALSGDTFYLSKLRSNICTTATSFGYTTGNGLAYLCAYNKAIESIRLCQSDMHKLNTSNIVSAFHGCHKLRKIYGVICINGSSVSNAFKDCFSLESVNINSKYSISFGQSQILSTQSIIYMINNVGVTTSITFTLHATAYARAMADADVQAALAAKTNVTLASA